MLLVSTRPIAGDSIGQLPIMFGSRDIGQYTELV